MFSSRDPHGDSSREKMLLHLDVLVAVDRLSDALSIVRKGNDSEYDAELYNCFLDKCQQGTLRDFAWDVAVLSYSLVCVIPVHRNLHKRS